MRIVTYNFLRAGSLNRSGHWSRVIRHLKADLVLAQECRPPESSPGERFRHDGCDALVWQPAGDRSWGSGLLARAVSLVPIAIPEYSGWVVGGEIRNAPWLECPLIIFSVHVPAGERGYIHTMHGILDHVTAFRPGADVVLGGDFNVAAGYRTIDNGIRFLRGERDLLDRLTNDFGLAPCWQAANPNRALAQTLRWSGNPSTPYHCDGIFVPRTWLPRLKSCRVVRGSHWTKLSDHNPVVAEFQTVPNNGVVRVSRS